MVGRGVLDPPPLRVQKPHPTIDATTVALNNSRRAVRSEVVSSIHTLFVSANGSEPGMYRNEINCEDTLDALLQ